MLLKGLLSVDLSFTRKDCISIFCYKLSFFLFLLNTLTISHFASFLLHFTSPTLLFFLIFLFFSLSLFFSSATLTIQLIFLILTFRVSVLEHDLRTRHCYLIHSLPFDEKNCFCFNFFVTSNGENFITRISFQNLNTFGVMPILNRLIYCKWKIEISPNLS